MCPTRQPGFTLLELVIVIAVLGMIAAFVLPDFQGSLAGEGVRESARRMETTCAMCRAEAINHAREYRVLIRLDGSMKIQRQLEPIKAPHWWETVDAPWARTAPLLDDVWVEAVQLLPDGPAPVFIVDDELEFPEMELEPPLLAEYEGFEQELAITFLPDGTSNSLRWVLRDAAGRALLMTLDGRLARVTTEPWPRLEPDDVERPEPIEDDDEDEYDLEDVEDWTR